MRETNELLEQWLDQVEDDELSAELQAMRDAAGQGDAKAVEDAFYQDLEFGTAGLQGIIGAGPNRMNVYTVGRATQGFADYLNENFAEPSVAIGRDSRNKGDEFVRRAASVFAANGIKTYVKGLFEPIFLFLPMNLISKLSPIISLSLRLFANILSGGMIMSLLYSATAYFSSLIPMIGSFNFFGVIIAPVLHIYFDLICGLLQTFIFTSLTIIFIGKELPEQ